MILRAPGTGLELANTPEPKPGPGQVVVRVHACGVCRTDLHVVDGELPQAKSPIVPGHEIVGTVAAIGPGVALHIGERVGVPWLAHTCGVCRYCRAGQENLCDAAQFTGCTIDGGYADYALSDAVAFACRADSPISSSRPGYAPGSSATVRCEWPATRGASGSMASARPRTSSRNWRATLQALRDGALTGAAVLSLH